MKHVLVTGGAGYIGSHCFLALAAAGFNPVIFDNLAGSHREVLKRLETITGQPPLFVEGDVRDAKALDRLFASYDIDAVIHFAALKAVGESVVKPLDYYDNNVTGTLTLLGAMRRADVRTFVFSSSATVYGNPAHVPLDETSPRDAVNPYGRTKLVTELILEDIAAADPQLGIALLRYFNPIGAHASGLIGEDPLGIPNNLLPFIAQVAVERRPFLSVFGGDYPTRDGTGIRDYIHVQDLAEGHVAALQYLARSRGVHALNLGTGTGYSVLEMIAAFEAASGRPIPYKIVDRRPGDIAECWADTSRAQAVLGWRATRGLREMCEDTWRWQRGNPNGYAQKP